MMACLGGVSASDFPPPPSPSPPPPSPGSPSPPPPSGEGDCRNSCSATWLSDGDCDDGGPGSEFTLCNRGTDCLDCGVRYGSESSSDSSGLVFVVVVIVGALAFAFFARWQRRRAQAAYRNAAHTMTSAASQGLPMTPVPQAQPVPVATAMGQIVPDPAIAMPVQVQAVAIAEPAMAHAVPVIPHAVPVGPSAPSSEGHVQALKDIKELHDAGVLTDAEFEDKKREILARV